MRVERPPPEQLGPERIRALLAWLSHRSRLSDAALAKVPDLVTHAAFVPRDWAQDPWLEFSDGEGLWFRVDAKCGCPTDDARGFCEHRAAVVVLALWQRPDGRELFERPCWALEFDYLSRAQARDELAATPAPAPAPRSDRPCRLLIHVFPTGGYERGFDFELRIARANKRGDGWLKPTRKPSSRAKLLAKAKPSPTQLRILDLVGELDELRKLDAFARQAPKLRSRVAHELLAAFAAATSDEAPGPSAAPSPVELRWEHLPITASTLTWRPSLVIAGGDPGWIEARWSEPLLDHWKLDPSIVLTGAGVLRPLADDVPVHLLERMRGGVVRIAADEFDAFARAVLAHAPVPVELRDPEQIGAARVRRREPRLYLSERSDARSEGILRCTAKLAYELFDGRCLEFGLDDRRSLSLGEGLTVVRDPTWERDQRRQFEAHVGREASVELLAEGAWSFLSSGVHTLREAGWVIFGESSLTHNRVAPRPLAPRMRLGPSTDWFELEVDFVSEDGSTLPAAAVIDSWLAGDRFVRLADERVAALPEQWLSRHARSLAELVELGREVDHGLGAHALPLARELLDELVADDPDQATRAAHWRGRARALTRFSGVEEREPPPGLEAELRPYQRRGFAWLCWLRDHGLGGCLADDMGLGKTVQALALLLDSHGPKLETGSEAGSEAGSGTGSQTEQLPSLIVCPTSVLHTWREQSARFAPRLSVHVHHGPRRGEPPADVDVILTSYALLRHDASLWAELRFRHLILDEAQALKNPDSQVARVARSLRVAHPLALTGTPLENDVVELWSLFELLMPGFFGSRRRFRRRWADAIQGPDAGETAAAALARLRARLRPFLLRRLKREVARELPAKQIQVLRCRLGKHQRELYERVRQTYRASVFGAVEQRGVAGATLHILEALTRLRQACCHPALLPFPEAAELAGAPGAAAKLELLRLLLAQAIADGHRSLVFSQWPSFLDHVAANLDAAGIAYLRLDGRTRDRGAVLDRWRAPEGPPVFLISTKAGGVGLDLTEADHVFHLDPWWNPATEDQATDRAHRIGQTKPVMVYKLVAADTVEDKILELQARKRRLFRATVDVDRLEVAALSQADLEAVFGDPSVAFVDPSDDSDDSEDSDDAYERTLAEPRTLAEFVALPTAAADAGPSEERGPAEVIELFGRD